MEALVSSACTGNMSRAEARGSERTKCLEVMCRLSWFLSRGRQSGDGKEQRNSRALAGPIEVGARCPVLATVSSGRVANQGPGPVLDFGPSRTVSSIPCSFICTQLCAHMWRPQVNVCQGHTRA